LKRSAWVGIVCTDAGIEGRGMSYYSFKVLDADDDVEFVLSLEMFKVDRTYGYGCPEGVL